MFGGPPSVDPRLSAQNQQALVQTLSSFPHDPARPTRPGFGTAGKPGVLRANFFPVRFPKAGTVYDYHVDITPKTDVKRIRARLFALLEQSVHPPEWAEYAPYVAHDGSARLVSSKKLPQPLDVHVLFLEEGQTAPRTHGKTYTIAITLTQEFKTSELHA